MRRSLAWMIMAAVVGVGLWAGMPGAVKADEPACIFIYRIYFDSPGADGGSNASRNAEWIQLKNTCSKAVVMTGYRVRDLTGHVYRFGTFTLGAGKYVKLHTGNGTNNASNRYWRSSNYIWNNSGDKAILKTSQGLVADSCRYTGAGSSMYC